jgi:hypothetical protein
MMLMPLGGQRKVEEKCLLKVRMVDTRRHPSTAMSGRVEHG